MAPTLRLRRIAVAVAFCSTVPMIATTVPAFAQTTLSPLVAAVTNAEKELSDLEAQLGGLLEAGNKALVDLRTAQANADRARQEVEAAEEALGAAQDKLETAQSRLDDLSRSLYRQGAASRSLARLNGADSEQTVLDRSTYLRSQIAKQRQIVDNLEQVRTEEANRASELREAQHQAEEQEAEATTAEQTARDTLEASQRELDAKKDEHAALIEKRDQAEAELEKARGERAEESDRARAKEIESAAKKAAAKLETVPGEDVAAQVATEQVEHTTLSDPFVDGTATTNSDTVITTVTTVEETTETSEETTETSEETTETTESTTSESSTTESSDSASDATGTTGTTKATSSSSQLAEEAATSSTTSGSTDTAARQTSGDTVATGSASELIETVIARAQAQIGVPYAWGGGTASGPSQGIRDGGVADSYGDFSKVGFDCSGLMLYAFAGVGINLPHYTGYQYQRGTAVAHSEMKRGDLIFYGPGGSQHVALYLGDGMMIEAPQSGGYVQVVPVRWSGLADHAVRLI